MATMALLVMVVDGHNGTVDSSCFLFKNPLLWSWHWPVLFLFVVSAPMVKLTLSAVDSHADTVDSCTCCCYRWLPWHCPHLVRFLCGDYDSTSTPVVHTDDHVDTVGSCACLLFSRMVTMTLSASCRFCCSCTSSMVTWTLSTVTVDQQPDPSLA
jgi:hypothetical protein